MKTIIIELRNDSNLKSDGNDQDPMRREKTHAILTELEPRCIPLPYFYQFICKIEFLSMISILSHFDAKSEDEINLSELEVIIVDYSDTESEKNDLNLFV